LFDQLPKVLSNGRNTLINLRDVQNNIRHGGSSAGTTMFNLRLHFDVTDIQFLLPVALTSSSLLNSFPATPSDS
jgi:hypothetical protein